MNRPNLQAQPHLKPKFLSYNNELLLQRASYLVGVYVNLLNF